MLDSSPAFPTEIESVTKKWQSRIPIVSLLICSAFSGWLWTQTPRQNQAVAVAAELPQHRADKGNETKNIEDVRLGERVVGRNPLREQTRLPSDIRPETHRTIRLEMIQHEALYELSFIRSLTWLQEQNAQADESIPFVLEEMGLNGLARIISIDPCAEIEPDDGTGRMVVTGTMKHLAGNVLEIQTSDDTEPLGVTGTHPIWSVDRQDFVVADQLEIGESLEQADGMVTQITRITPTRGPRVMVYNLEIDGEHVFRVGEDGLLVHNSCPDNVPKPSGRPVNLPSAKKLQIDMDHIATGHMKGGSRVSPKKDLFPDNWSRAHVERAIRDAYKSAKRILTQGDRILVRGTSNGKTIEMWINKATKTIETAYPVGW